MRFISRVILPLLLFIYIATETYLKLNHSSLCGEVGCKLAGQLLNFNALYLNYFGLVGVFFLIVLGYLSLKNKLFETLFFIGLYSAIAFETTIISYQFMANPEPCIFCLGIISSLLAIALFTHPKNFVFVFFVMVAIFLGLSTLAVTKNKAFVTTEGTYLIQSATCPHCKKVKSYLHDNNISYTPISTKESSARSFLKFANITSIPVLILKTREDTQLLVGDQKIIAHFKKVSETSDATSTKTTSTTQSSTQPNFLGTNPDAGCAITVIEVPDCEKTDALPFNVSP